MQAEHLLHAWHLSKEPCPKLSMIGVVRRGKQAGGERGEALSFPRPAKLLRVVASSVSSLFAVMSYRRLGTAAKKSREL